MSYEIAQFSYNPLNHRGALDSLLAEDVLRRLESALSQIWEGADWIVALYLLYSPEDRHLFNSWDIPPNFKMLVAEHFQESARREMGNDVDSDELKNYTLEHWGYYLEWRDDDETFCCWLKDSSDPHGFFFADIGIYFFEAAPGISSKGRFTTVVRSLPIITNGEPLRAALSFDGQGWVAPHIELSQRRASGGQKRIYFTRMLSNIIIGPFVGCDLVVPSLQSAVRIACPESLQNKDSEWFDRLKNKYGLGADFNMELFGQDSKVTFGQLLDRQAEARHFSLKVVARVLPRAHGSKPSEYGSDWCNLSAQLPYRVLVSVRLNEEGDAIAADEHDKVFIWRNGDKTPQEVGPGEQFFKIGNQDYLWEPDESGTFYGSLTFKESDEGMPYKARKRRAFIPADKPFPGVIARGGAYVFGMESLLSEYVDDDLISARGSINLYSDGKGHFKVTVAETSALRTMFILEASNQWRSYSPDTDSKKEVEISNYPEFIFGSSRYQVAKNGRAYKLPEHWSGKYRFLTQSSPIVF